MPVRQCHDGAEYLVQPLVTTVSHGTASAKSVIGGFHFLKGLYLEFLKLGRFFSFGSVGPIPRQRPSELLTPVDRVGSGRVGFFIYSV